MRKSRQNDSNTNRLYEIFVRTIIIIMKCGNLDVEMKLSNNLELSPT